MAIHSAEFEGLDELIKDFQALGEKAMPKLKSSVYRANMAVYRNTVRKTAMFKHPTGLIESSIQMKLPSISKKSPYAITSDVHVGKQAAYIGPLELGHAIRTKRGHWVGHVEGVPFMRNAADESKEEVANILIAGMDSVLKELGDK